MLDLQQALAVNHHPTLRPVCQLTDSSREPDFNFWGEHRTGVYENYDCSAYANNEVEFRAQTGNDDGYGANSPSFPTSPLLLRDNHYSCQSPKSRSQAIKDGRKELMEMIQDVPESSYELSLKDIVNGLQDIVIDEKSLKTKHEEAQMKQQKKNCQRGQMSRSVSMDSGVFLLKLFFPISIGLKRKSIASNRSKVSQSRGNKEWWKMRFLDIGESKKNSGSSSSTSSRSRNDDINFTPSCWSFDKKCRSHRQRGCLL